MAPTQPCSKYQYVLTTAGPKIVPVPEQESKDEESPVDYNAGGYLPVKVNDSFKGGRYLVVRKLGWGHFSTVWLVKDSDTNRHSALKVVKSAGRYAETARDEIKLLSRVSQASPTHPGRNYVVSFLDSFSHAGPESSHVCIVFEPLGENLLALIERHKKKGVPRALVKVLAKQILLGLAYLHDECDLVHTDIKPENILISIPDIEAHIQNELSLCPSPTSRRVGVPLPTKSRAGGVSIPHSHAGRATRRQVQIFDSQPLASPGRGSLSGGKSNNNSASASNSGGKPNSMNLIHMSRIASSCGPSNSAAASATDNTATTSTHAEPAPTQSVKATELIQAIAPTSPSTSTTSSSSLSLTSMAAASTPATSVGQGSALGSGGVRCTMTGLDDAKPTEPIGMAVPIRTANLRSGVASGMSMSWNNEGWQDHAVVPGLSPPSSWKEKTANPSSLRESLASWKTKSVPGSLIPSVQNQPLSSSPLSSLRKDPAAWLVGGTSTPAPALLVSASVSVSHTGPVVQSEDGEGSFFQLDVTGTAKSDVQPSLLTQTAPREGSHGTSSSTSSTRKENFLSSASAGGPPHTPLSSSTISPASITPRPTSPPPSPTASPSPSPLPSSTSAPPISIKIADLGNATPSTRHFTEDIQTRQYRAPEAIVGRRDWDARVDVWSLACVVFELLTAEYLFDPQGQGELFTKDDDHMAQIVELLGDFPLEAKMGGKYSRELFDHTGGLRYIKTLKPWSLKRVMVEKYLYTEADAVALCAFLEPMLAADMRKRALAREMAGHAWLEVEEADGEVGEW